MSLDYDSALHNISQLARNQKQSAEQKLKITINMLTT